MHLEDSVQYIKGVGPARFKLLNRLGVHTVGDLLYYFPRRYEDRRAFSPIAQVRENDFATVKGEIINLSFRRSRRGLSIFEIAVGDESGVLSAIWFNQPFMKKYFKIGDKLILYGKIARRPLLQMNAPDFELISELEKDSSLHIGRIVPIYPLTANLKQRYLRTVIDRTIQKFTSFIPDMLPYELKKKLNLLPLTLAIRYIHFPKDNSSESSAYRRLVFDEFFLLQMIFALKRYWRNKRELGITHKTEGKLIKDFLKILPFKLTSAQDKAIKEIEDDMASSKEMNRLLQGDVGSGKTIVAAYALILSVQSGFQAAVMAPTEILAEQHYLLLSKLFAPLDVSVGLLIGSMSPKAKLEALEDIKSGAVDIVVGTHALIEKEIEFKKLGLVVIDEQHKFGTLQRSSLRKKGERPDCLIMTATPIPRTLAMTLYADLDISTIKELPKGRLPISTVWVKENAIRDVYNFIRQEVSCGRQAYIVYPLIENSPRLELRAATEMYESLRKNEFNTSRVGLIHGRMKKLEKEKVMQDFKNRKIDILVATTVIEVGIDIPNASVMVIKHAERFGLSQLHQLRGRIGRGPHPSYCILVSQAGASEKAKLRIDALVNTQDGFRLAQEDLDIRGPGKVFGPAQHGLPELKLGNIVKDMELMELARDSAFSLVKTDPELKNHQHSLIREKVKERLRSKNVELISV